MTLYLGNNLISGVATPIEGARNIGQIITSTIPLSDAGLHLLDGAVIQGSGSYADFVTYIAGLVSTYPDLFETEANWQTSVTNYGVCGKFVYDSVNNTVRLPKITGFIEGTTDLTALGDLIEAGLPNITGNSTYNSDSYGLLGNGAYTEGAFNRGSTPRLYSWSGAASANAGRDLLFDASRSSSIYGNSTTVQPQSIKVLYYICIATSTKTEIEVDIDEIATDLNDKADVDLSNINPTQTVKNTIVGWGMPDYSAGISLSYDSFVSNWTAPSDGVICGKANWNSSTKYLTINGSIVQGGNTECYGIFFFVSKGDVVHNDSGVIESAHTYLTFYPLKGVQNA